MSKRLIKITIEYDGTGYVGWQVQPNGPTVQEEVEKALKMLTDEDIRVRSASRTDSGVHALGQVATFYTESSIPAEKFAHAITSRLPKDIAVRSSEEAPDGFDPRHGAKRKLYRYRIATGPIRPALERRYLWHVKWPVDTEEMIKAAAYFTGTHNFTSFSNQECNTEDSDNTRTIDRSELIVTGDRITYEIEGRSFLYNMVRNITGTLVDVGLGNLKAGDIPAIFEAKDRQKAGQGAPACGLCLMWIKYE
ncbi:MAG: tRNA pseudouridine(38-40) synthase TruA [Planctomycetes bacterium]|nr:tRNA pseudouridine(38-40) synthase TruA [Planctomycetota bacterium]